MKVTCQACSAQYTIADDKVRGRKVKIRCKACQTPIVVDGQNPPPEAAGSGQSEAPPPLDPFVPEAGATAEAEVWNVNLSETDSRTMTAAEVIEAFKNGAINSEAFVWKDGMPDWVPIMECVELAPLLSEPTHPPAPVAGQTPLAPEVAPAPGAAGMPNLAGSGGGGVAAARAASAKAGADLFGDIEAAGSEGEDIDIATSARGLPTMPGSTAYDDKPTGARNENSVLFSLDSLKAGFAGAPAASAEKSKPAAPKPGAPRPNQPSNPDDPFGMGAGAGLASIGTGANPLFSMSANQALLIAPAPPEPKPLPVAAFGSVASAGPGGMDEKTKKLVLYGGAGAGAVILLLLGLLLFGGSKGEEASNGGATAAASAEPAHQADEKKDEPKEEAKDEKKQDEAAAAPSASASAEDEKKDEEAKADEAKAATHTAATHTSTATKKEEPAVAAPSTAPPFSKAAAISALGAAAGSAGACKKAGGPTGVGKVIVTFAPSGRVTNAQVNGPPFGGTSVGGCVANIFRRAHVPAFSGSSVTVSKSFMIN